MSVRTLRTVLLVFLVVQVAILAVQHADFLPRPDALPEPRVGGPSAGNRLVGPAARRLLAASAAWARGPRRGERFAIAGLANVAAVGLAVYAGALATGRLFAWLPWAVLVVSAAAAALAGGPG